MGQQETVEKSVICRKICVKSIKTYLFGEIFRLNVACPKSNDIRAINLSTAIISSKSGRAVNYFLKFMRTGLYN